MPTSGISPPDLMLKIIWMVHFVLTTWALMSNYLLTPYMYSHVGVLAFGFWAIVSKESVEAIIMMFITLAFTVMNDILLISIYEPRTHDYFENSHTGLRDEHRFAVAMSIINLLVKPVSLFILYRIYQSRSTGEAMFSGNLSNAFRSSGGATRQQQQQPGPYSNIDSSSQGAHPGIHGQNPQPQGTYYGSQGGYQATPPGYQDASAPAKVDGQASPPPR